MVREEVFRMVEPARQEYEDEEYVPLDIPPEYRDIGAREKKLTVRELWQLYCNDRLVLEPDFQRHYVWDTVRASRYVESLLLRLPTPPLFLSQERNGTFAVIDGHQRLETLFRFMQPLLKGPAQVSNVSIPWRSFPPLTLKGLEVMSELNGRGVTALDIENRERLWDTQLSVVEIPNTAHPDMKYVLFARLNQGSMSLNNQELRNCLFRGPYNRLIAELSEGRRFLDLWEVSTADKRMRHRELVLRFFAFLHRLEKYRPPLKTFLNAEMEANAQVFSSETAKKYRHQFENAVIWVDRVFGKEAFRLFRMGSGQSPSGSWSKYRYDLVYEVEMVGFAQFGDQLNEFWQSADAHEKELLKMIVRHRLIDVMSSKSFTDSLREGTTRPESVRARFEPWNRALQSIALEPHDALVEADLLYQELKDTEFCAKCAYPLTPDDAVWLYIEGKRKLVHRFCHAYASDSAAL